VVAVVSSALVVGAAVFARAWSERGADEASVDEAIESQQTASTVEAADLQPATGVYTYSATGTEALSLLDTGQGWGDTIPATVTALAGGCWEHRMEFSTNHRATQRLCPDGDRLLEEGSTVFQSFDFVAATVDDETVFTCDPPSVVIDLAASPGDSWPASCDGASEARGTSTRSAGDTEFLGEDTIEIAGEEVRSLHYRHDRTITGDQTGVNRVEHWYDAATGLLLKGVREVEVASPSPIGDVTYTESGSFVLDRLSPAG
jgi:hypothetical protein